MTIDELIARLMRLSEQSPRGSATEVLLRNEGDMGIEGASLGMAKLPRGRSRPFPVVILQAGNVHRTTVTREVPGRPDRSDEDPDDQTVQGVHAGANRSRLCRAITRKIDELEAATGERSHPLEHLLAVIGSGGLGRADADAAQLRHFDDLPDADFARALEICEATGARVIHSGSRAVYYRPDDKITVPSRNRFHNPAAYFNTRLRLTARWAERRVGWEGTLAEGQLVAVLASVFLADAASIPVVDDADYRGHHGEWLRAVRRDAAYLDRVLDQARRVADFILAAGDETQAR